MTLAFVYQIVILLGCFILSWFLTRKIRSVALDRQVMDIPNERSCHTRPTPRGGGLAFVGTFVAACLLDMALLREFSSPEIPRVLAVVIPLALLGLVDDVKNLPARTRLVVHLLIAAAALFLFPDALYIFGEAPASIAFSSLLVVVGVAALINFYNFMDGTDALVAGCFFLQGLFFALHLGQSAWLLASAAVLGFLYWNRPPAKIFMGDIGSTVLGGAVACAIVAGLERNMAFPASVAVTLPLTADAAYTIFRRLLKRENIFAAHRQHIYQRLHVSAGWTHGRVALAYMLLTALFGAMILTLGTAGAWASLIISAALIISAEIHLNSKKNSRT
mgnify:CR=1 FL=1